MSFEYHFALKPTFCNNQQGKTIIEDTIAPINNKSVSQKFKFQPNIVPTPLLCLYSIIYIDYCQQLICLCVHTDHTMYHDRRSNGATVILSTIKWESNPRCCGILMFTIYESEVANFQFFGVEPQPLTEPMSTHKSFVLFYILIIHLTLTIVNI